MRAIDDHPASCSSTELRLDENEHIIGFGYLGTLELEIRPRELPSIDDYLSNWK
jgi:hypothetical protein